MAWAQTWIGGAGDWTNPANWVGGIVPNSPTADVWVDGGNPVASSVTTPYDFVSANRLTVDAGDSVTIALSLQTQGDVTVNGALRLGGISGMPGRLQFKSAGVVTLGGSGEVVMLAGSSSVTATRGLVISSTLRVDGNGTMMGGSGTNGFLANYGTLSGTIEFAGDTNNYGTIEAVKGGRIKMGQEFAGRWRNFGTLRVDAKSMLELSGTFDTADIGRVERPSGVGGAVGRVSLTGVLNNTGSVLDLDTNLGGPLELGRNTAIIRGGTVRASAGSRLLAPIAIGGELDGVTLEAGVQFTSHATMSFRNGLELRNIVIDLTGPGGRLDDGSFAAAGTQRQTISGVGEIRLGNFRTYYGNIFHGGVGTTLAPGIYTHGTGSMYSFVNQGRIVADVPGRTLTLWGSTNQGTITVTNGASLEFADSANEGMITVGEGSAFALNGRWRNRGSIVIPGAAALTINGPFATGALGEISVTPALRTTIGTTVDNAGATLDAAVFGGTLALNAAVVRGGTIAATGGSRLVVEAPAGTNVIVLDGVTLATGLAFNPGHTAIDVQNGLTLAGTTIALAGGSGTNAFANSLRFVESGPQQLDGAGVISGGGIYNTGTSAVTIGPGVRVGGGATLTGPFVNLGEVVSERGPQVNISQIANKGILRAAGGTFRVPGGGNTNDGIIRIEPGGHLWIDGGALVQTSGTLHVDGGITSKGSTGLTLKGGTLSGSGTIFGEVPAGAAVPPLFVPDEAVTISPGATEGGLGSVASLVIRNYRSITLPAGTHLFVELGADGSSDQLKVLNGAAGIFELEPGASLDLAGLAGAVPYGASFVVATYEGTLTGTFTHVTPGYLVDYGVPHEIRVTATPEPRAVGLLGLGVAGIIGRRRRR